jgi:predicted TIM-barrel fold metal-dependent hydrolase
MASTASCVARSSSSITSVAAFFVDCEGNESALSYVIDRIGPQGCVFASDFPHEIAMEDALDEINEILERKDINVSTNP